MHHESLGRRRPLIYSARAVFTAAAVAIIVACADNLSAPISSSSSVLYTDSDGSVRTIATRSITERSAQSHSLLASLCAGACPDSVILDFEGLVVGIDSLANQYTGDGVTFDGGLIVSVGSYNSFDYPPRSGTTVALANVFRPTSTIGVTLDDPALLVRGYITAAGPVTLACQDSAGAPVGTSVFPGGNLGRTGLPTNQPLEVASAGIRSCLLSGPIGEYTVDDLTVKWGSQPAVTISISRAMGPRSDSSFTTADGENRITLEAVVTPSEFASQVRWSIIDHPGDAATTVPPAVMPTGAVTSFLVPAQARDWNTFGAHPGDSARKTLAYEVRAEVTVNGVTIRSAPSRVRQSRFDTMRQEYFDYAVNEVPDSADRADSATTRVRHFEWDELNHGDYLEVAFLKTGLTTRLTDLRDSVNSALPLTSTYRNPVHHRFHIVRRPGEEVALQSNHQSGNAADIRTASDTTRWTLIAKYAKLVGLCVEPMRESSVNHVHVDWRGGRAMCGAW